MQLGAELRDNAHRSPGPPPGPASALLPGGVRRRPTAFVLRVAGSRHGARGIPFDAHSRRLEPARGACSAHHNSSGGVTRRATIHLIPANANAARRTAYRCSPPHKPENTDREVQRCREPLGQPSGIAVPKGKERKGHEDRGHRGDTPHSIFPTLPRRVSELPDSEHPNTPAV